MGFLDKMADALDPVTGGGAVVDIAYPRGNVRHGERVNVRVYVSSTGGQLKTNGVFVDVVAMQQGNASGWGQCPDCRQQIYTTVAVNNTLVETVFPLSGPFVLETGQSLEFEGDVQIPDGPATNRDRFLSHIWYMRGRVDAFGNDPDSGYKEITVV